jgi:hypothetical protein
MKCEVKVRFEKRVKKKQKKKKERKVRHKNTYMYLSITPNFHTVVCCYIPALATSLAY